MSSRKGKEKVRPKLKNLPTMSTSFEPPPSRLPVDHNSISVDIFMPTPGMVPPTQCPNVAPSTRSPSRTPPTQSPSTMEPPPQHSPMDLPSHHSHQSPYESAFQSTSPQVASTSVGIGYQRYELGQDENIIPIPGGMFYPTEEPVHRIKEIVQTKFNEAWPKWTSIPQETRRMWFEREFAEKQTGMKAQFPAVFLNTHKKKKKNVGEWVDPYAASKFETFNKEKERLLSTQASLEGSSDDPDNSISMPSDEQLWRQVVGEKKGRVYGMGSQAQTMWSGVHQSGGSSSSRQDMVKMEKKMDTLQESVNYLMQCFRHISPMQQPAVPYAPWMPSYPSSQMPSYPPTQMPPSSSQMPPPMSYPPPQVPPPASQMPPPMSYPPPQMPPPASQMPPPPSQMPPPYYYPWMQPPPGQHLTPPYPWMQPPYPSAWPQYSGGPSHTQPQAQNPTNENAIEEEEDEEDF